jgi:hypothetical protein
MPRADSPHWNALLKDAVEKPGIIHKAYAAFHDYSIGNQIAAYMQCIDRKMEIGPISTYQGWQRAGRQVRKGEKAIFLCMPLTLRRKDENLSEGLKGHAYTAFCWKPYWFVMSQTDGEAVPELSLPDWSEDRALKALNIERVEFEAWSGNTMGYATGRKVAISPLSPHPLKTLFHELAHIVLEHTERHGSDKPPRSLREVEAEGVALLLTESLNLSGAEYARGYIQHWLETETIPDASAAKIFGAADKILKAGYVEKEAERALAS